MGKKLKWEHKPASTEQVTRGGAKPEWSSEYVAKRSGPVKRLTPAEIAEMQAAMKRGRKLARSVRRWIDQDDGWRPASEASSGPETLSADPARRR